MGETIHPNIATFRSVIKWLLLDILFITILVTETNSCEIKSFTSLINAANERIDSLRYHKTVITRLQITLLCTQSLRLHFLWRTVDSIWIICPIKLEIIKHVFTSVYYSLDTLLYLSEKWFNNLSLIKIKLQ